MEAENPPPWAWFSILSTPVLEVLVGMAEA